jgi:hypothetical protein
MSYRIPSVMKRNRGQGSTSSDPTHTEAGYKPAFADDHLGYQYNMQDNTFDHLPHMQQTVSQLEACSPVTWRGYSTTAYRVLMIPRHIFQTIVRHKLRRACMIHSPQRACMMHSPRMSLLHKCWARIRSGR